jgi:hypothetical protein
MYQPCPSGHHQECAGKRRHHRRFVSVLQAPRVCAALADETRLSGHECRAPSVSASQGSSCAPDATGIKLHSWLRPLETGLPSSGLTWLATCTSGSGPPASFAAVLCGRPTLLRLQCSHQSPQPPVSGAAIQSVTVWKVVTLAGSQSDCKGRSSTGGTRLIVATCPACTCSTPTLLRSTGIHLP